VSQAGEAGEVPASTLAFERVVIMTLASVQFISIVDFTIIMPLGPQLMRSMHIGPAQFGLVVSSYTFAAGIAGFVASSLVDRLGRKAAFLGMDAGFLIGTFLCGLAPTYGTLVLARILTGMFGGILGRSGAGDYRRRLSRGTARPGDGRPHVGVRAGFARRRPLWPVPGNALRLARAVHLARHLRLPGLVRRRLHFAEAAGPPRSGERQRKPLTGGARDLHAPESCERIRPDRDADDRRFHGVSLHQPIHGEQYRHV
jgi:hypothetical protein